MGRTLDRTLDKTLVGSKAELAGEAGMVVDDRQQVGMFEEDTLVALVAEHRMLQDMRQEGTLPGVAEVVVKDKPHKEEDNQQEAPAALKRDIQKEHMKEEQEHTRLPVVRWACELGVLVHVLPVLYPLSLHWRNA